MSSSADLLRFEKAPAAGATPLTPNVSSANRLDFRHTYEFT
jgi:hypothetical protein